MYKLRYSESGEVRICKRESYDPCGRWNYEDVSGDELEFVCWFFNEFRQFPPTDEHLYCVKTKYGWERE